MNISVFDPFFLNISSCRSNSCRQQFIWYDESSPEKLVRRDLIEVGGSERFIQMIHLRMLRSRPIEALGTALDVVLVRLKGNMNTKK
jgi:hypothetical protein